MSTSHTIDRDGSALQHTFNFAMFTCPSANLLCIFSGQDKFVEDKCGVIIDSMKIE